MSIPDGSFKTNVCWHFLHVELGHPSVSLRLMNFRKSQKKQLALIRLTMLARTYLVQHRLEQTTQTAFILQACAISQILRRKTDKNIVHRFFVYLECILLYGIVFINSLLMQYWNHFVYSSLRSNGSYSLGCCNNTILVERQSSSSNHSRRKNEIVNNMQIGKCL